MLIDKDQMVKIQWSDNYRQYYINKGYKYTGRYNALEVKVSDLPERSSVLVLDPFRLTFTYPKPIRQ